MAAGLTIAVRTVTMELSCLVVRFVLSTQAQIPVKVGAK